MAEEFDSTFWESRYGGHPAPRAGRPSPHLVSEIGRLPPGTALDAGCGEGADARWLAARGWRVTAVDISAAALRHAREHAGTLGAEARNRLDWVRADLTSWTPPAGRFDLVTTHYVHTTAPRKVLFDRLGESVSAGGTLLIVGHHPSDTHSSAHASGPQVHATAEEIAADLGSARWDIVVAETRTRSVTGHNGRELIFRDTVLRARKHP